MDANRVMRVCSQCGFKDRSLIPPIACPRCHWQPEPNAVTEQLRGVRRMNRHERRAEDAKRRITARKVERMVVARENAKRAREGSVAVPDRAPGDLGTGDIPDDPEHVDQSLPR